MRTWSIPAGQIFGVEVRIHLTFFFLLFFVLMTESTLPGNNAFNALGLVAIIFGSVVLHELGHALMAIRRGLTLKSLLLLPIGGMMAFEEDARSTAGDGASDAGIALAGPVVNLSLAAMAALFITTVAPDLHMLERPYIFSGNLLRSFVWVNLALAGLNLLPAFPLDAGRILRAYFARTADDSTATRRAVTIGQAFSMALILAGYWNTWLMMTGFFLFVAAQLEERTLIFQSVVESVRLEEIMLTDFATLSPADTLEDALSKAVHSLQDDFPVVRGTDMVGVISRQRIVEALRHEGNGYVQSVMHKAFEIGARKDSLASGFKRIGRRGLTLIPVVEENRLVGIVTLQNLMHSMGLLAESRKLRQ